jgi:hypothetical protein
MHLLVPLSSPRLCADARASNKYLTTVLLLRYLTFRLFVCTKCALTQDTAFTAVAPLNSTARVLFFSLCQTRVKARPSSSTMTTRSMLGDQPLKASAPKFSFGSSTRDQAGKVFVSQEHTALATAGKGSPGPAVYTLPPSVGGKQPDGRRADPPAWGFGTAQRFRPRTAPVKPDGHAGNNPGPGHYSAPPASVGPQVLGRLKSEPLVGFGTAERKNVRKVFISQQHQKTDLYGMGSPGPAAAYTLKSTMGKQEHSTAASMPSWVFGSASRAKDQPGLNSPGPAAYSLPQSVGPQPDSRRPRAGTPGFGASTRDIREKVYVGPGHDKGSYGRLSPGPAASYTLTSAVGRQVASNMGTQSSAAFSKEDRWAKYNKEAKSNTTPGPGAY